MAHELLTFLGIYPETIESAANDCEKIMDEMGFTVSEIDDMWDEMKAELSDIGSIDNLTDAVIYCAFNTTKRWIEDRFPGVTVEYYVNGDCSSIELNKPEQYDMTEDEIRNDWEKALALLPTPVISKTIEWGFTQHDLKTLARIHKEGWYCSEIEDLLEDCNFHTECSQFSEGDYSILDDPDDDEE